jgi:hypothetical protein
VIDRTSVCVGVWFGVVIAHLGGVGELGCHVVWCPKYRGPVVTAAIKDWCEELVRAKAADASVGSPTIARYVDIRYERRWCTVGAGDS